MLRPGERVAYRKQSIVVIRGWMPTISAIMRAADIALRFIKKLHAIEKDAKELTAEERF